MHKLFSFFIFAFVLNFSVTSLFIGGLSAQEDKTVIENFVAGENYTELKDKRKTFAAEDEIEVISFFWYGCGSCYKLDEALSIWGKNLPVKGIKFVKVPALLGGPWDEHGKIYLTIKQMGVEEKLHKNFFKAVHEDRVSILNNAQLAKILVENGVDKDKFVEVYNSKEVEEEFKKLKQLANMYGLTGVPAVIVNAKYQTGIRMANGQANLIKLIDFLIAKEAKNK